MLACARVSFGKKFTQKTYLFDHGKDGKTRKGSLARGCALESKLEIN